MPRILFRSWPLLTSITLHGVMAVVLSGMGISIPQPPTRPRQSAPVPTIRWEPRPSIQTPQPVTIQMPVETTESVSETAVEPTALELVFEPLSEPLPELIEVRPPLLAAAEATLQDVEDVETAALQKPP
ncbi:MAG: hypothetical protein OSB09_07290, partial [Planctomycetota bacterium]|nr:hypothetical protein [Planctomycetota bacterium]